MAGQGIERREILRMLAIAAAVSECQGFARWTFAFAGDSAGRPDAAAARQTGAYAPRFFTAEEYAMVALLAALIIPADDTPGAAEAGVAEFIDTMAAHDRPLQPRLRRGLAWLHARSLLLHGRPFEELPDADQLGLLERLAYAAKHRPGEEEGRRFFTLIREYTVMGYYTSRVGLESLGYPGLRMYAESPGCPDPSDPLHRHRERPRASAPPDLPAPSRLASFDPSGA
jgi:gluconate 2-dehydrogenase gamma chain